MSMSKTTILITVLAIVFLVAVAVALQHLGTAGTREVVNRYHGSEFSFTYPLELELEEYTNDSFSIGSTTQNGFSSAIDLTLVTPEGDTIPSDFAAYMREQVLALCTTEEPTVRVSCSAIESEANAKNAMDESVTVYTLTLVRERAGEEAQTYTFGPIYGYIVGPHEEDGRSVYSALFVHTPLSVVLAGATDAALLTRINDSIVRGSSRR